MSERLDRLDGEEKPPEKLLPDDSARRSMDRKQLAELIGKLLARVWLRRQREVESSRDRDRSSAI